MISRASRNIIGLGNNIKLAASMYFLFLSSENAFFFASAAPWGVAKSLSVRNLCRVLPEGDGSVFERFMSSETEEDARKRREEERADFVCLKDWRAISWARDFKVEEEWTHRGTQRRLATLQLSLEVGVVRKFLRRSDCDESFNVRNRFKTEAEHNPAPLSPSLSPSLSPPLSPPASPQPPDRPR